MTKKPTKKPSKSTAKPTASTPPPAAPMDPALLEQIAKIRTKVHETFGQVSLAMMVMPRYRNLPMGDMQRLILNPLMNDRIAIAKPSPNDEEKAEDSLVGIAIWATVSQEVDAKIREQIKAGVFPIQLQAQDWISGEVNWLLDVIAPSAKLTASVIANFKQVIKKGDLRIHPIVSRMLDPETLEKIGAAPVKAKDADKVH